MTNHNYKVDLDHGRTGKPDLPELCSAIIEQMPLEQLLSYRALLDVGCGYGGLSMAYVKRVESYIGRDEAFNRIWLIDTHIGCVNRCRRLGFKHVVHADFLSWEPDMQFDAILANPPYQQGANNKFFAKFFERSVPLLKDGGYFAMLAPTKGALVGSKYARQHLEKLGWSKVTLGINKWFPGIGTTIAQYSGTKGEQPKQLEVTVEDQVFTQDFSTPLPMSPNPKAIVVGILRKFFDYEVKVPFIPVKEHSGEPNFAFVPRQVIRYTPHRPRGGFKCADCGINDWAGRREIDGRVVITDDAEGLKTLLQSDLYRFIWSQMLTSNFIPPFVWDNLPQLEGDIFSQAKLIGLSSEEVTTVLEWAKTN
jgi:SAM-dependent methyltransferase